MLYGFFCCLFIVLFLCWDTKFIYFMSLIARYIIFAFCSFTTFYLCEQKHFSAHPTQQQCTRMCLISCHIRNVCSSSLCNTYAVNQKENKEESVGLRTCITRFFCGAALEAGNLLSVTERDAVVGGGWPGGGRQSLTRQSWQLWLMILYHIMCYWGDLRYNHWINPIQYEEKKIVKFVTRWATLL